MVLAFIVELSFFKANHTKEKTLMNSPQQTTCLQKVYINYRKGGIACPEIRHNHDNVQIFMLFKPIGLCGAINAQKNFGPLRPILTPPR